MKIKECIDIVDNLKPNQYSIEDKVDWLSYIDHSIINEVLLTHEGYDGRYDDFVGYSPDVLDAELIVPSPYDRLYPAYIKMKIDEENGETARYNNSVTLFNAYFMEYKKWYNSSHMPLSPSDIRKLSQKNPSSMDVTDAQLEQLKKLLYAELHDDMLKEVSDENLYAIVKSFMDTNAQMLRGKDGRDGVDGKDGNNGKDGLNGANGVGIQKAWVTEEGELKVTLTNGVTSNLGVVKGEKGDRGERGMEGPKGDKGDQGEKGEAFTYNDFTEEQIEALKVKGDQGEKGDPGADGKSAYEYAQEGGFEGTEEEFKELIAQTGQTDLSGYITKEEHETKLLQFAIKQTTEKAEFLNIQDSAKYKVLDFGMEGKTEQETVPGNQLFDMDNIDFKNKNYCTITNGEMYFESINNVSIWIPDNCIPFESDEQITISAQLKCGTATKLGIALLYEDGTHDDSNRLTKTSYFTATVTSNASKKVVGIGFLYGDNGSAYIKEIMLNPGDTALPIEKYVGGMPSPNPEYEQPITLAGVYNEEIGRYEHKCCVGNKNHWDAEYASVRSNWIVCTEDHASYPTIKVRVLKGMQVTVSYKKSLQTGLGFYACVAKTNNTEAGKYGWLYHSTSLGLINNSLTFTAEGDYIYIGCSAVQWDYIDNLDLFMENIGNDLQIEISSSATELLPHASQQFTLTSDRPLTMWDYLTKRDGVWGWSVKQLHLTVDNNVLMGAYITYKGFKMQALPESMIRKEGYCNQMPVYTGGDGKSTCGLLLGVNDNWVYNIYNPYYDDTLSDYGMANFKEHLAENPLEIVTYSDTEQAFIPLPDEEQELLHNLETYYGVTNVYNEQGCPMWIKYVTDTKLYVDKKLLEIQSAMI